MIFKNCRTVLLLLSKGYKKEIHPGDQMAGKLQKRARMFILVRLSDGRPCQLGNWGRKGKPETKYTETQIWNKPKETRKRKKHPPNWWALTKLQVPLPGRSNWLHNHQGCKGRETSSGRGVRTYSSVQTHQWLEQDQAPHPGITLRKSERAPTSVKGTNPNLQEQSHVSSSRYF